MRQILIPLYAIIIFLLLWEFIVWFNGWPNYKMASPSDLWPAFWKFKKLFFQYGWDTLWRTVAGLFLAVILATVVPIIALMFGGQHDLNTILIAFMISFFPIAVSISIGLSTLEPEYRDILRSLGASKSIIFWKIALPKTLPEFFGALKVAVTLAFIGTNLMEIVSPHGRGLGALFDSGKTNADYPLMFAVLIGLAILGIALYYVVVVLEKIFAGWAERSLD